MSKPDESDEIEAVKTRLWRRSDMALTRDDGIVVAKVLDDDLRAVLNRLEELEARDNEAV